MTPEERAEQVYEANYFLPDAALKTALAAAIRDAICEEREACARVAGDWQPTKEELAELESGIGAGEYDLVSLLIAAAIRARKGGL